MNSRINFVTKFFLQSSTVFIGSAAGNFLLIVSLPFITSIYTTSSFGFHALFYSGLAALSALITSRLEMAVVISKKNEVFPIFILSLGSIALYLILTTCLFYFFNSSELLDKETLNNINELKFIILFGIAFLGLQVVLESFLNREQNYSLLSISRFLTPVCFLFISFFPVDIGYTTKNLIIAQSFAPVLSISIIILSIKNTLVISTTNLFSRLKNVFIKYKKFPAISAPTAFLDNLAASSPIFLIGILYSEELVALYALALRLGYGPLSMISRSVSQVTLRTISSLYNENKDVFSHLLKLMTPFSFLFIPILLFVYFAENIIELFFDDEWLMTGKILKILVPIFFYKFFVSCFSTSLEAMDRVIAASLWKLLAILTIPLGIYISSFFLNETELFISLSIIEFILYSIYLFLILYFAAKANSQGNY